MTSGYGRRLDRLEAVWPRPGRSRAVIKATARAVAAVTGVAYEAALAGAEQADRECPPPLPPPPGAPAEPLTEAAKRRIERAVAARHGLPVEDLRRIGELADRFLAEAETA